MLELLTFCLVIKNQEPAGLQHNWPQKIMTRESTNSPPLSGNFAVKCPTFGELGKDQHCLSVKAEPRLGWTSIVRAVDAQMIKGFLDYWVSDRKVKGSSPSTAKSPLLNP